VSNTEVVSSDSFLEESEECGEQSGSWEIISGKLNDIQVEETDRVFITQDGGFTEDSHLGLCKEREEPQSREILGEQGDRGAESKGKEDTIQNVEKDETEKNEQIVVEDDMICESINNLSINASDVGDQTVAMEIAGDQTVVMETIGNQDCGTVKKGEKCTCFENNAEDTNTIVCECLKEKQEDVVKDASHVTDDGSSHVVNGPSTVIIEKSSVVMPTMSDHEKEVVTIRIEVDDEFEPEFTTRHSLENITVAVNDSCHGNQNSFKTCELGVCESVVPKIQVLAETESTPSSNQLAPIIMETSASDKSLHEISKLQSWNSDRQMEKLMNEELDVHPSLRSVSPALGFVRSMVTAAIAEIEEEAEEEGEETEVGREDDQETEINKGGSNKADNFSGSHV
jgi:hypothetical protein